MTNNNKNTYCPDLWEMFTLDNKGNIFHCNHIKPAKIGNIYSQNLLDLLNNPISLKFRNLSLEGNLNCYKNCNWVNKSIENKDIPNNSYITEKSLKRIHIHWGLPCNISCVMCNQRKRIKTNTEILSAQKIIENIDITLFDRVFLSGGEPLYIDECLKYMDYLESINKKYILLTNGLLIDNATAQRLVKFSEKVVISINAATSHTHEKVNRGSNFNKLLRNISFLKKEKDKTNSKIEIIGRITITVQSLKEISIFITNYKKIGFDKINFGYDKATVPAFLNNNPEFYTDIKNKINDALKSQQIKNIDLYKLKLLNLIQ